MMMMMIRWDVKKEINIKKDFDFHKTDISIEQQNNCARFTSFNFYLNFIIFLISFSACCVFGKDTMKNHPISKEQNLLTK